MKLCMSTLAIEVTRRCNMGCAHCMRGDAQNKDITHEVIDHALKNVTCINEIVFTGGEPTLNVDAIEHTLKVCRENDIYVGAFYIVTNAKEVPDRFLIACINWYSYIVECGGDVDVCGIAISRDKYHEPVPYENIQRLKAFSIFREDDKTTDWNRAPVQNLGRAKNLNNQEKREHCHAPISAYKPESDEVRLEDSVVTITVDGDVLAECDYEYANADKYKLANVFDAEWESVFEQIASDPNFCIPA